MDRPLKYKGLPLDQAFILPLPETKRAPRIDDPEEILRNKSEMRFIQYALDRLRLKKISWDSFFRIVHPSDPVLRSMTAKEGDNILHLAVIHDLDALPKELAEDKSLLWKRNDYGLNPIEISQFLNRGKFSKYLGLTRPISFQKHPGTHFDTLKNFESLNSLCFISHPVFENEAILYDILNACQKAKAKDKIPPEKTWMGIYFDKEIQYGLIPPVSIRFIDNEVGFGVFAEQKISPCSFVGEYTGIIQERKRKLVKDKMYCVRYTAWDMGRRNFIIDAESVGNFSRFINHSDKLNLSLQSVYWRGFPRMIFIALKEIAEGTQLTFDYGTFFWKECNQVPRKIES